MAQERHGYSLIGQQQAIREYCECQGWELIKTFSDTISGAAADEEDLTLSRVGFEDLIAAVNGHQQARYVVVVATSRLWRSTLAQVLIVRALKRVGLDVRSIEEPRFSLHSSDPADAFFAGVMMLLDQHDRLNISIRTKRGRLQKARQGGYSGGGAPYGYTATRDSKVLAVNDQEAEVVRLVFRLRDERGMAPPIVAAYLNERAISTRAGAAWRYTQVSRILGRRSLYQGRRYSYGGVTAAVSSIPAILVGDDAGRSEV
jgi:DNA invertase Pin-like site-specific DNA recombinase